MAKGSRWRPIGDCGPCPAKPAAINWWLDSEPRTLSAQAHRPAYGCDGDYFSKPNIESVIDAVLDLMGEVDPERLWSWISLRTAELVRQAAQDGGNLQALSALQRQADLNRGLSRTPVRKDLLLQDWLIQWSRLNA